MTIQFQAQFDDKGGTKEPLCRKITLLTQELDSETMKQIPELHGQTVVVTITY